VFTDPLLTDVNTSLRDVCIANMSVTGVSVSTVKQVVMVRILPTDAQAAALRQTLRTCNEAASWLAAAMHAARVYRKRDAQKRFYIELKPRFELSAQPAIRVIGKVADAYTSLKANVRVGNYGPPGSASRTKALGAAIRFREVGAQPFDARCLSWQIPEGIGREGAVSIWTTHGRLKGVRVLAAPRDLTLLRTRPIGEVSGFCMPRSRRPMLRQRIRPTIFLVWT
jgi:hypothetical protein